MAKCRDFIHMLTYGYWCRYGFGVTLAAEGDRSRLNEAPVPPAPDDPLVERLLGVLDADPVLNYVLPKFRCVDARHEARLHPAGVYAVACVLAATLGRQDCDRLAFALPRGTGPLPALLGLYLALCHKVQALTARPYGPGPVAGSLSVATTRPDLRQVVSRLSFDGSDMRELVEPGKLVSRKETGPDGRVRRRAAAVPLRGGERVVLSRRDSFILFHRPLTMPPVAHGVIKTMIVDAVNVSGATWAGIFERNRAALRNQLWLGELGDGAFEHFCDDSGIPLVRFDWPLLAACATLGKGRSPLASTGLELWAQAREPIVWRLVSDEEREDEFAKVYEGLRAMRRRGGPDTPDALRILYRLAGLLSRLACPLELYEQAAGPNPYAINARTLMAQCEQISSAAVVGSGWKHAFDDHLP